MVSKFLKQNQNMIKTDDDSDDLSDGDKSLNNTNDLIQSSEGDELELSQSEF